MIGPPVPPWVDEPEVRAIPHNRKSEHPHTLLFFDTETVDDPLDNVGTVNAVLQLGCAERVTWNRGTWSSPTPFDFTTVGEFWDLIETQAKVGKNLWVFAHNFGGFDINVVGGYQPLVDRGWTVTKAILNCPPFVVDLRKDRRGIRLIDSLNYARAALAVLGDNVGVPKMVDPGPEAPVEERFAYCRNDVKVLRTFVCGLIDFCQEHDLGNFGITMASIAKHAWQHRFAPTHITRAGKKVCKVFPTTGERSAFERKGYMAGRTEAFTIGEVAGPITAVDANSMFPAVMRDGLYPWRLRSYGTSLDLRLAAQWIGMGRGIIAEVELETEENWYPVRGERIIFPVGRFTTWLCTPELDLALRHGHVVSIGEWQSYDMADLFRSYVTTFYDLRRRYEEEGNTLYASICKVGMLNSLYGKYGQKIPEWEDISGTEEGELAEGVDVVGAFRYRTEGGPVVTYRTYGGKAERLLPDSRETAPGAFVAIAAHVTSYARMRLLEGFLAAGPENVHYCDTDSLYVNRAGFERLQASGLIDQTELGKWKVEKTADDTAIFGAKDYFHDGKRKIKGVRKNAVEIQPNTFEQTRFRSFKGNLYHQTTGRQLIYIERKTLTRIYRKGVVQPDGRVRPFRYPEERHVE